MLESLTTCKFQGLSSLPSKWSLFFPFWAFFVEFVSLLLCFSALLFCFSASLFFASSLLCFSTVLLLCFLLFYCSAFPCFFASSLLDLNQPKTNSKNTWDMMGYFMIYPLKTYIYIITCNGTVNSVNSTDIFHTISSYVIWFPQVKWGKKHPIQASHSTTVSPQISLFSRSLFFLLPWNHLESMGFYFFIRTSSPNCWTIRVSEIWWITQIYGM